jgi:dTDP-4-amino-4,6-dideoxygalactose transaminase
MPDSQLRGAEVHAGDMGYRLYRIEYYPSFRKDTRRPGAYCPGLLIFVSRQFEPKVRQLAAQILVLFKGKANRKTDKILNQPRTEGEVATQVPLLDLKGQYAPLRTEIEAVMREVCDSQHFIMGPKVETFEAEIATYSNAAYGVGASSGTDALLLALMALDIGPGDEVITTPFTFFATAGVVSRLGARPVFCDVNPDSYNLDPTAVKNFIGRHCGIESGQLINKNTGGRVRVLMPVHLYGQCAELGPLMAVARENGLRVVEDAAQAIGSEDSDGRRAGSIGDIGCFSFFPSKNLGAFGDAGMCVTNDAKLAEKMKILRVHGGERRYYHSAVGGNFRLDSIQAAVLSVKLKYLDQWSEKRQQNAGYYDERFAELGSVMQTPSVSEGCRHIYNQYTIRVANRNGLKQHLLDRNIGCEIYYVLPLHLQDCFKGLGYREGDLPESEAAAESVLSIPIYPELTTVQLDYVADAVCEYLNR